MLRGIAVALLKAAVAAAAAAADVALHHRLLATEPWPTEHAAVEQSISGANEVTILLHPGVPIQNVANVFQGEK